MSTKIYLFKTHPINISNLAIAMAINNAGDRSHQSNCKYQITDNKFFNLDHGPFFLYMNSINPDVNFRDITWNENLIHLTSYLTSAKEQDQFLIFGSHINDQLDYLKSQFSNDVFTISINYTTNSYPLLLTNMAEYHWYLLTSGQLPITEIDEKILLLPYDQIIQHYKETFDQLNLIPKSSTYLGQYNIDISDFFNIEKMTAHFINIGLPFNSHSLSLYTDWLSNQPNP